MSPEPAHPEPAHPDPAHSEPAQSEPAQSEPAQYEPAHPAPGHSAPGRLEPVGPEVLDQLFREVHTAYTFEDTPLSEDVLTDLFDLVRNGPTSVNGQPLRMIGVRTQEAKDRLVGLLHPTNRPKTLTAPLTVILAADTRFDERLAEVFPALPGAARFFGDDAGREQSARFNAAVQIGCLLVAVRALGLAVGPIGGFDHEAVDTAFFPGSPLRTVLVVNIGHPGPDAFFPRSPRLPAGDVVSWI
jgi:3-hydroxypropanoate dehydrogenase